MRQHVGLIARREGIEQERSAIRHHTRRIDVPSTEFIEPASSRWTGRAFIAPAQNRHAPSPHLQSAREFFNNRRFTGATNRKISDADNEAAERPFPEYPLAIKQQAQLHNPFEEKRQGEKKTAQERGANAVTTIEDNVDRKRLEIVARPAHRVFRTRAPPLSAVVTRTAAFREDAADCMADATALAFFNVTQATVEPEPLRNPPSAPADSPAAIMSRRWGFSSVRNG